MTCVWCRCVAQLHPSPSCLACMQPEAGGLLGWPWPLEQHLQEGLAALQHRLLQLRPQLGQLQVQLLVMLLQLQAWLQDSSFL